MLEIGRERLKFAIFSENGFHRDDLLIEIIRVAAIVGGAFMLRGHNWARWLVLAWIGFHFARRYGGSKRAGWGALAGGLIGAVVGVPVPIIGSTAW